MKSKTMYECEICGGIYNSEQVAKSCENHHVKASNIIRQKFTQKSKFPDKIIIEMENGEKATYKYNNVIEDISLF